jgi:hypothetical protein
LDLKELKLKTIILFSLTNRLIGLSVAAQFSFAPPNRIQYQILLLKNYPKCFRFTAEKSFKKAQKPHNFSRVIKLEMHLL